MMILTVRGNQAMQRLAVSAKAAATVRVLAAPHPGPHPRKHLGMVVVRVLTAPHPGPHPRKHLRRTFAPDQASRVALGKQTLLGAAETLCAQNRIASHLCRQRRVQGLEKDAVRGKAK